MEGSDDVKDAVRLLIPARELADEVYEVILECQKERLIRIEEDGAIVLTHAGRRMVTEGSEDQNEEAV